MSSVRPSGALEPTGPGRTRIGRLAAIGWVAVGLVALLGALTLFPRAFPAAPGDSWTIRRGDAVAIVLERLRDLGERPPDAYVTATLRTDPMLELRLLEQHDTAAGPLPAEGLPERVALWRIAVYHPDAGVRDWDYLGEVTLRGEPVTLLQGVPSDFESPVRLEREDAIVRADAFLEEAGFSLDDYFAPVERLVEMTDFSYQLLRYQSRERTLEGVMDHGIEVRFAGDELKGFVAYEEDPRAAALATELQGTTQLQFIQILVVFLLVPVVAVVFVRRYHQGLVGVRRGTQVFLVVLLSSLVALFATARGASEGMDFGGFTRPDVTLGWLGLMLLIYVPTLAALGGMSCAVGESIAHGTWRGRLASLDAVLRGRWANSTVAAASLRGAAAGLLLLLGLLLAVLAVRWQGFEVPFSLLMGPWWPSAGLPGPVLLLVQLAFTTTSLCFCLLAVMPLLASRVGVLLAGVLSALVLAVFFFAPTPTVPTLAGFPASFLFAAATVWLFVRYDFMTAFFANLVASAGPAALALLASSESVLRLQGTSVLVAGVAPLWVSMRYLLERRPYHYSYDDVPPHVRRIAERERHRVELETARGIQASILPDLPPRLGGVELAHTYLPATEVGGDFYDAILLDDGRLAVAVGDVAGHGVSSGLIMSMARSALAVQVTFRPEVEEVVAALNRVVYRSARRRLFTTFCYALLDPASGSLSFASAGHIYPYRVRPDGTVHSLESTAYPLGVRERLAIQCRTERLDPGDAIFLSSDGLVEARRWGGEEMFGFERLSQSLSRLAGRSAGEIRRGVLDDLEDFVTGGRRSLREQVDRDDDLTILVVRLPVEG